jgi:hypothetical protein
MVSSVGYGAAASLPSRYQQQVSDGQSSAATSAGGSAATADRNTQDGVQAASSAPGVSVSISPQAAAAAARDAAASGSGSSASADSSDDASAADGNVDEGDVDLDGTSGNTSATDPSATDGPSQPSDTKSFTYGVLGLERPDQTKQDENQSYSIGRWVAAGLTIGGIISLFV